MLKNILKLNGATTLTKQQLQSINGGSGTCAYFNSSTGCQTTGLSSSQAQGMLANADDHWCCNNCSTASWADAPDTSFPIYNEYGDYIGVPGFTCG